MASVNGTSVRQEVDVFQKQFQDLRKQGKVNQECEELFRGLLMLIKLLLTVLMEKITRKTSRNSGLPPSQTDKDESARRTGSNGKGPKPNQQTGDNLRTTTVEETIVVDACDACGADLHDVDPVDRECRVLYDIVFEVVERRVEAEIKGNYSPLVRVWLSVVLVEDVYGLSVEGDVDGDVRVVAECVHGGEVA